MFEAQAIRGTIDSGAIRALVRETAPGGAWSFPFGTLALDRAVTAWNEADWEACLRLRSAGFRLAQMDLAVHLGEGRSTWGNEVPVGQPVSAELLRGKPPS